MGLGSLDRAFHSAAGRYLVYTPFIMILLLAGLRSLPKAPFEAAALDGVPRSFVFFRITLPMLMPYIITATLFRLLDTIQQFDIIYAMTQGGPGDKLLVFQVQAYLDFFQATKSPICSAHDHPVGDHLCAVQCLQSSNGSNCASAPTEQVDP